MKMLSTPKPMQNSIWTRAEVKKTTKNWSIRRGHKRNKVVAQILFAKSAKGGGITMGGVHYENFQAAKDAAAEQGITHVRMGAINAKVS